MFFKQKIPLIPPLFHDNKFVTDFLEKAELFNSKRNIREFTQALVQFFK